LQDISGQISKFQDNITVTGETAEVDWMDVRVGRSWRAGRQCHWWSWCTVPAQSDTSWDHSRASTSPATSHVDSLHSTQSSIARNIASRRP